MGYHSIAYQRNPDRKTNSEVLYNDEILLLFLDYNRAMLPFLLQGLTLGFAAGAQPGPFQTYLISQTLSQGWRRTWIAAFAPLISDGPIVALALLVLSQVPDWFQRVLQIVGGLFVLSTPHHFCI